MPFLQFGIFFTTFAARSVQTEDNMTLREYVPFYRRNLKVAFPVMVTQAGQVLVQLADNIMVGHLGAAELAGVSFANAIIMIGLVFAIGFTQGVTPAVGQHFGKGDGRAVAVTLSNSAVLNAVMAIMLTCIMLTVGTLMGRMGQDPEVLRYAREYYNIIIAGFIPMIAFFNVRFFSEGIGNTRNEMWITIATNAINIFLNWVLIYGNLGAPRLGVAGAAWATLISRVLGAIAFIVILFRVEEYRRFVRLTPKHPVHLSEIFRQLRLSLPISLQNLLEVTAFSFAAIMVGWMGKYELAAHQIAQNLSSLSFMITTGIGAAATIRVSHQFGAGRRKDAYYAGFAAVHMAMAIMVGFGIIFICLHKVIPYMYTEDTAVIPIAGRLIIILALFQVFDAIQLASRSSLLGLKDINVPLVFSAISYYIICLPSAYFLGFTLDLGPEGVWIGLLLGLAVAALLFNLRFRHVCRRYISQEELS